jgi:hypothetical protein
MVWDEWRVEASGACVCVSGARPRASSVTYIET